MNEKEKKEFFKKLQSLKDLDKTLNDEQMQIVYENIYQWIEKLIEREREEVYNEGYAQGYTDDFFGGKF